MCMSNFNPLLHYWVTVQSLMILHVKSSHPNFGVIVNVNNFSIEASYYNYMYSIVDVFREIKWCLFFGGERYRICSYTDSGFYSNSIVLLYTFTDRVWNIDPITGHFDLHHSCPALIYFVHSLVSIYGHSLDLYDNVLRNWLFPYWLQQRIRY